MIKLLVFMSVILLGGCAIQKETYLPDGSKGYTISCNGSANSISTCYEKAGEICGAKGYDLLTRDGESNLVGYSTGSVNQAGGAYVSQVGAFVSRSIMIRCKS